MAVPRATYGSGTWIVITNHETGIQTAEVKFIHGVAGYICIYHQCNTEIKKKLF